MLHLKVAIEAGDDAGRRESRLDQAYEVLTRAIRENDQGDNPAAWYYLGRYFVARANPWGADSAFRRTVALAPQCVEEARRYVGQLEPVVLTRALEHWQGGDQDSAVVLFRLAQSLNPENADVPLFLGMMYIDRDQLDSATRYVQAGLALAGDDPKYDRRKRQALLNLARGYDAAGFESPAIQRIAQTRMQRDSLLRVIARDSALLAGLIAEWGGKRLRPEVQQAVSRDSARLASKLAQAQEALPMAQEALARDSAAVDAALAPALEAYTAYLDAYPDDADATERLLRRVSLAGRKGQMDRLITRLLELDDVSPPQLTQIGVQLFNDGHTAAATQVLETALQRNRYMRNALFLLCRAYYALEDAEKLQVVARQLLDIDPLNPQSVRMMAAAWNLAGHQDSTLAYIALADTGIGWSVTVTQLVPTATTSVVNGSVANIAARPLPATSLEFDFLDTAGNVLGTASVPVPALQPRARQQISARIEQGGAVAWRYRRR